MSEMAGTADRNGSVSPPSSSPQPVLNAVRRLLLIPRVAALGIRAPRDPDVAWERFWGSVRTTGSAGEVLWDLDADDEFTRYQTLLEQHFDSSLPIIDVGCGNGRFTRWLGSIFPRAIGVDVAEAAVRRANQESKDQVGVEFLAVDAADPAAGDLLHGRYGDVNVFIRGVLHVLNPKAQQRLAANAHRMIGATGRLLLAETDFPGGGLAYLQHLGATPRSIPMPLERAIRGLPQPGHFGTNELARSFPRADWRLLVDGPTEIRTVPLRSADTPERIPGYLAVLAARGITAY